jgi:hypothetical protein
MPDWQELVRQRLAGLTLDPAVKEEVHAELAAHLEESYEALRAEGLSEGHAVERTLREVTDWRDLQDRIAIAKSGGQRMRKRTYQIWIPGLLTFALSTIFLIMLQRHEFQPRIVSWRGPYAPWLLSLPCLGALAAHLSSRAGGSRYTVLLASIFPVVGLAAAFLLMFPIGLIVEQVIGRQVDFGIVAMIFLNAPIGSLLVPGAALLAGGLPVQFLSSRWATLHERATT